MIPTATAGPPVAALVLAAGRSVRMGRDNKLLAPVRGLPLVRRVVLAALASQARPVHVVLGHEAERVRSTLEDLPVTLVFNKDFERGLSASLRAGLDSLPAETRGALICLGDMPGLTAAHLDGLIARFDPVQGRAICVPVHMGRRGNPVLWSAIFFSEMKRLTGDAGAKSLLLRHAQAVYEVEMPDDAILIDVDTPDALAAVRGALP